MRSREMPTLWPSALFAIVIAGASSSGISISISSKPPPADQWRPSLRSSFQSDRLPAELETRTSCMRDIYSTQPGMHPQLISPASSTSSSSTTRTGRVWRPKLRHEEAVEAVSSPESQFWSAFAEHDGAPPASSGLSFTSSSTGGIRPEIINSSGVEEDHDFTTTLRELYDTREAQELQEAAVIPQAVIPHDSDQTHRRDGRPGTATSGGGTTATGTRLPGVGSRRHASKKSSAGAAGGGGGGAAGTTEQTQFAPGTTEAPAAPGIVTASVSYRNVLKGHQKPERRASRRSSENAGPTSASAENAGPTSSGPTSDATSSTSYTHASPSADGVVLDISTGDLDPISQYLDPVPSASTPGSGSPIPSFLIGGARLVPTREQQKEIKRLSDIEREVSILEKGGQGHGVQKFFLGNDNGCRGGKKGKMKVETPLDSPSFFSVDLRDEGAKEVVMKEQGEGHE